MARIKGKKTNFETNIFRALRRRGLNFQTHYTRVVGKPDIAVPSRRRAVFLHSDFWHGWRLSLWEHILPDAFWKEKLAKNRKRDKFVLAKLRREGWQVLVVWEHQIRREPEATLHKIEEFIG